MHRSKVCFKCEKRKSIEKFYRHPMMGDGRLGKCKECTKSDARATRLARLDYYRAYDRERAKRPERRKLSIEQSRKWRSEDRRRMAAHNAVTRAIRSGKLERMACQRCGREDHVFGHHESYDRKLDVTWLCQPCHKQRHKEMVLEGIEP